MICVVALKHSKPQIQVVYVLHYAEKQQTTDPSSIYIAHKPNSKRQIQVAYIVYREASADSSSIAKTNYAKRNSI